MNKILIIGQALPAVAQSVPYDTTMLYVWLQEVGVSKEQAQELFEFEAVCPSFPGSKDGNHLKPSKKEMHEHWDNVLRAKVEAADKIWVLGNVARDYINTSSKTWSCSQKWLHTIHPSRRNWHTYTKNKLDILAKIKELIG